MNTKCSVGIVVFLFCVLGIVPVKARVSINPMVITKEQTIEVVAPGPDLQDIIDGITDEAADKPYLIKLGPGEYTITADATTLKGLVMAQYISIKGSGQGVTILKGAISTGTTDARSAVVSGANNAELSHLTVKNTGSAGLNAIAIYNNAASPRITDVAALSEGGAYAFGVYNTGSSPAMTRVFCSSILAGTRNYGVFNSSASNPPMQEITVIGIDLFAENYGIYNGENSNPFMRDVFVLLTGGAKNFGIYNLSSSPTMESVTVRAALASVTNRAVQNDDNSGTAPANPIMRGVHLVGDGGTGYGIFNHATSAPKIHHSILEGSTNPLFGGIPKAAYTQFNGPLVAMPASTCLGAYSSAFAALSGTCT